MKKIVKGICVFAAKISALAIFAGACFVFAGFSTRLPHGVKVNGCDVGGLTLSCAEKVLRGEVERDLRAKTLRIYAGECVYEYSFPEIYYHDDFARGIRSVTKKGDYFFPVRYYLNGQESIAENICAGCEREKTEPYAHFNLDGEPFDYCEGCDGVSADRDKLLCDIDESLNGGDGYVTVQLTTVTREGDMASVKKRTQKLASFTTYFDNSNFNRASNIRLAAEKINGLIIPSGGEFSFNAAVGARTRENGFKEAKIIEDGKFVTGVGGGVCQVSTTLYNAAVLSGLDITEYHPHSLAVSYVAPSRDAMVSGSYCDLRFANNRKTPIYLRAKCVQGSICCTFYGESDGWEYSIRTQVTGSVEKPAEQVVEGDEDKILSYGKEGLISEGYLVKCKGDMREVTLLRRDRYLPVADIRQVKKDDGASEGNVLNGCG